MCLTVSGRLQTRVVTLVGPLGLALCCAALFDNPAYLTLFGLMALIALFLDAGVYSWLIGFQPRWATLVLASMEFLIIKWVAELPYPLELRLRTVQMLQFFLGSWILIWLTLSIALPSVAPRWAEEGGEFILSRPRADAIADPVWRRQAYLQALGLGMLVLAPWFMAMVRTPPGAIFTGLLIGAPLHLATMNEAVEAARAGYAHSVGGLVGVVARHAHDSLQYYRCR